MMENSLLSCQKCGSSISVEEHHIHPRFMDNPNGDGKKIYLCKSCHNILHQNIIPVIIWSYVQTFGYCFASWKNKVQCIEAIKKRTIKWITEKEY